MIFLGQKYWQDNSQLYCPQSDKNSIVLATLSAIVLKVNVVLLGLALLVARLTMALSLFRVSASHHLLTLCILMDSSIWNDTLYILKDHWSQFPNYDVFVPGDCFYPSKR